MNLLKKIFNKIFPPRYSQKIEVSPGVLMPISWDTCFMSMAYLISMKSKDQSTHIGAIVVGDDNEILSCGFNSFPRDIDDNVPERQERENGTKYFYFEHAERNSVYNACRIGVSLKGATMYTQGFPCADCARAVINAGIKTVVLHRMWDQGWGQEKWKDSSKHSMQMFKESGIEVRYYDGPIVSPIGYRNKNIITFSN